MKQTTGIRQAQVNGMAQPQIFQQAPPDTTQGRDFYTICRTYNDKIWMLSAVNPRRWTTNVAKAIPFGSHDDARVCIKRFFKDSDQSEINIAQTLVQG